MYRQSPVLKGYQHPSYYGGGTPRGGARTEGGKFTYTPTPAPASDTGAALRAQLAALQNQYNAMMAEHAKKYPWIPDFNPSGARGRAEGVVNPRFQKQVQLFVNERNIERQGEQNQYSQALETFETALKNYFTGTGTQRTRTTEDVGTKLTQLTESERLRQKAEGREFDVGRRGLQQQLGQKGLSFSGLGRQQLGEQVTGRAVTEEAQTQQVEQERLSTKLFKTRTFEDLATGEAQKTEETTTGKKFAKVNLDQQLAAILAQEEAGKWNIETDRIKALLAEEGVQQQNMFNEYLSGLNQYQVERARRVYGR